MHKQHEVKGNSDVENVHVPTNLNNLSSDSLSLRSNTTKTIQDRKVQIPQVCNVLGGARGRACALSAQRKHCVKGIHFISLSIMARTCIRQIEKQDISLI